MRLSFMLLITFIATSSSNGNVQSTAANTKVKMANMASTDTNLMDGGLNVRDETRFLQGNVAGDNEERLSGANMFDTKKIEEALGNTAYAKTLFRRWARNRVEDDKVLQMLNSMPKFKKEKTTTQLYGDYITCLNSDIETKTNLFPRAKIDKAIEHSAYAHKLFERWKRYGYDSDYVLLHKLKFMDVDRNKKKIRLHEDYVAWLRVHHPNATDKKLTSKEFLFVQQRLDRVAVDTAYAEKLHKKWKTSGFDSDPVYYHFKDLHRENDPNFVKVYEKYVTWLDQHYPLPLRKE
ncbi:RxLR effector protein [Phytophthora megakarya]|uniref:RxLR effector protein n=1 Tax=Phytophthora megakarya TaxID=4795 RepID=A0A225V450_9STRA|nr:RxLR effector protein [Phytophthora megakarya]